MRLNKDIDGAFLDLLEEVIEEDDVFIAFAGYFDKFDAMIAERPSLAHRCAYTGFQNDIMAFFELCDAYINSRRVGGGSAIVHAFSAGLPGLSLSIGDAAAAVSDFPPLASYTELAQTARLLCRDSAVRAKYREYTEKASSSLTSRKPLVDQIVAAYENYCVAQC